MGNAPSTKMQRRCDELGWIGRKLGSARAARGSGGSGWAKQRGPRRRKGGGVVWSRPVAIPAMSFPSVNDERGGCRVGAIWGSPRHQPDDDPTTAAALRWPNRPCSMAGGRYLGAGLILRVSQPRTTPTIRQPRPLPGAPGLRRRYDVAVIVRGRTWWSARGRLWVRDRGVMRRIPLDCGTRRHSDESAGWHDTRSGVGSSTTLAMRSSSERSSIATNATSSVVRNPEDCL